MCEVTTRALAAYRENLLMVMNHYPPLEINDYDYSDDLFVLRQEFDAVNNLLREEKIKKLQFKTNYFFPYPPEEDKQKIKFIGKNENKLAKSPITRKYQNLK
jgi:hypothetical protein